MTHFVVYSEVKGTGSLICNFLHVASEGLRSKKKNLNTSYFIVTKSLDGVFIVYKLWQGGSKINKPGNATPESNFNRLYSLHFPRISRQLQSILGDQTLAEDIAQETFLKLYSTPPAEFANPGGWLSRVATNLAYNFLRGERHRRDRENRTAHWAEPPENLEERLLRNQEAIQVKEVLDRMPVRDRTCLVLKFTGYSYEEIAGIINVEKSSVGTILARARARFKEDFLQRERR